MVSLEVIWNGNPIEFLNTTRIVIQLFTNDFAMINICDPQDRAATDIMVCEPDFNACLQLSELPPKIPNEAGPQGSSIRFSS